MSGTTPEHFRLRYSRRSGPRASAIVTPSKISRDIVDGADVTQALQVAFRRRRNHPGGARHRLTITAAILLASCRAMMSLNCWPVPNPGWAHACKGIPRCAACGR